MVGVTGAKASTQRGEFYSMFLAKMHEQNIGLVVLQPIRVHQSWVQFHGTTMGLCHHSH
jgi:hypothetical protein